MFGDKEPIIEKDVQKCKISLFIDYVKTFSKDSQLSSMKVETSYSGSIKPARDFGDCYK